MQGVAHPPQRLPPTMLVALTLPLSLLLLFGAATPASQGASAPAETGGRVLSQDRVYALERVNGKPVPAEVEFASTAGSRHWIRMEEAILRLRRDGTFVASARFYRELVQAGRRPPAPGRMRLLSDGATGRYRIRGDTIVLNVNRRRDSPASTVYGRMSGSRLRIRHVLRDGNIRHDVDVMLRVDPTIW